MKLQNKTVKHILDFIQYALLILLVVIFIARAIDLANFSFLNNYYQFLGNLAAVLYLIAMVAGSMQRFNILKPIYSFIIYYRRQIGTFMYIVANFHFTSQLVRHPLFNPTLNGVYEAVVLVGIISLIILTPVYLTSNNFMLKLLKQNWKTVQRLSYIAFFFITLHMLLAQKWLLFIIFLLEGIFIAASWIYKYRKHSHQSETPRQIEVK